MHHFPDTTGSLFAIAASLAAAALGCGKASSAAVGSGGHTSASGGQTTSGGRATGGVLGSGGQSAVGGGGTTASGGGTTASGGGTTASAGTTVAGGRTAGTGAPTGTAVDGGNTTDAGGDSGRTPPSATASQTAVPTAGCPATCSTQSRHQETLHASTPNGLPKPMAASRSPTATSWCGPTSSTSTARPMPRTGPTRRASCATKSCSGTSPTTPPCKGGLLVIEGRKERVSNPNYQAGSSDWKTNRQYAEYTSTSMTTWNLQSWQYGRFEMRARIPTGAGMWPAWWTLGVSGEWPSNGEIDIMEYYKGNILANVACGTSTRWQAKWDSSTKSVSSLGGAAWAAKFHVWRMDWDDQKIDLYVDDLQMNTTALSSMLNADGTSPFKQKHYMLVNLAIGGVNGGDPAGTTFPVKYEVDWIRVFQKL